jgi:hypothetical protein
MHGEQNVKTNASLLLYLIQLRKDNDYDNIAVSNKHIVV